MELKSTTGRKIRKDSFEANHDMEFVINKVKQLYLDDQLSTNKIPKKFEVEYGIKITSGKCYQILSGLGILRNKSESVSLARSSLNYDESFLTPNMISIIDGIVIGDGTISINKNTRVGRLCIGGSQKEFIFYCYGLLKPYFASKPKFTRGTGRKGGTGTWSTTTKCHPDLYKMYLRWYPNKKDIPSDIVLTPLLMLLWYLGDGSLSSGNKSNSKSLYFSTNSFSRSLIDSILSKKLNEIGIETSRITNDNRLFIKTNSIVRLLNYMGNKSPVDCYSYKFDIEDWRYKKTMKAVAIELDVDYQKLANWVKTGFVNYSRSPGGKKILFSENEFDELKKRIESGELPREKGKKAIRLLNKHIVSEWSSQILKHPKESNSDYLSRFASICIKNGFPYKIYSTEQKEIKWYGLRKSQYVIPESSDIKWRRHGLSLADSFHPHIFKLKRKNKISPFDLFNNQPLFEDCLRRNGIFSNTLTYAKIHSAVCADVKSPRLNNFAPLIARDLYNYYCKDDDKILDPCSGFSGRLIGASIAKKSVSYNGIEPSVLTYEGLIKTQKFLNNVKPEFSSNINNGCAEIVLEQYRDEYFNFCFTSPPYFDTEEYATDKTQSHIKFGSYDKWKMGFLSKMISEIYRVLAPESYFAINIGKSGKHNISDDILEISNNCGFRHIDTKHIVFPVYGFVDSENKTRKEPLLIFQK